MMQRNVLDLIQLTLEMNIWKNQVGLEL